MSTFEIITGIVTIASFLLTVFVSAKVVRIHNKLNLNMTSVENKRQKVSGKGNFVAGGDLKYDGKN